MANLTKIQKAATKTTRQAETMSQPDGQAIPTRAPTGDYKKEEEEEEQEEGAVLQAPCRL